MGWLSRFPARIRRPERNGGALLTLALSFNNDGPFGTFFRYIGDTGTYIARYDDLVTGRDEAIDVSQLHVSMNSIEFQDREFIAAVREGRELNGSVRQVMSCYGWAAPARTATLYAHCLRGADALQARADQRTTSAANLRARAADARQSAANLRAAADKRENEET